MAAQDLINILGDHERKKKLFMLIEQQAMHNQALETCKQEKAFIDNEIKKLGLKPAEFRKIVTYTLDKGDLLFNEMATLEAINDNLVSV